MVDVEVIRLDCLREAVKLCLSPIALAEGGTLQWNKDPLETAKEFAAFVLGEKGEPADDSKLAPAVRAFDDEGEEL